MPEQDKACKIETGGFARPGDIMLKHDDTGIEQPEDHHDNDDPQKPKIPWWIIAIVVLVAGICLLIILLQDNDGGGGGVNPTPEPKYSEHGFTLKNSSLILVDREYFEKDPTFLCTVCENIDHYSQAYRIHSLKASLSEIKSKALIAELIYSQSQNSEEEMTLIITDPKGGKIVSGNRVCKLIESGTVYVNLDDFYEEVIAWDSGLWHITIQIDGMQVRDFLLTIGDAE
ncbi:hypothetical protein SAMN06297421_104182 [Aristaeella hokkaidonensis]|nr:hypothetical protein SAMN06297421_104182 [Aristaeella hokkaidonensis]